MININSNFARLFFIAGLSMTLAACTVNPPVNNTGGGTTTGGTTTGGTTTGGTTTGGTTTGGGSQTGGGTIIETIPGQEGFVVQLTASVDEHKARQLATTFSREGYHVIENKIERNGRILYRVQIGPYASKDDAKAGLVKLKNRYKRNAYVRSAFVNENK
ncbi:MAG: hypothetical protein DSZ29_01620 [Aquificaceae bacterium]|nr:MAG: hypothetical protein DSZ29_01620 [Aquificaceae bacterium]